MSRTVDRPHNQLGVKERKAIDTFIRDGKQNVRIREAEVTNKYKAGINPENENCIDFF